MEQMKKYRAARETLLKAYSRLEDSLAQDYSEYIQDSVIQRFEFINNI